MKKIITLICLLMIAGIIGVAFYANYYSFDIVEYQNKQYYLMPLGWEVVSDTYYYKEMDAVIKPSNTKTKVVLRNEEETVLEEIIYWQELYYIKKDIEIDLDSASKVIYIDKDKSKMQINQVDQLALFLNDETNKIDTNPLAIDKILKGVYVGSIYYFYDDLLAYRAYDYMYVESDDQYYLIDYRYINDIDCKDGFAYTVKK